MPPAPIGFSVPPLFLWLLGDGLRRHCLHDLLFQPAAKKSHRPSPSEAFKP